jgi:hypothetical protein
VDQRGSKDSRPPHQTNDSTEEPKPIDEYGISTLEDSEMVGQWEEEADQKPAGGAEEDDSVKRKIVRDTFEEDNEGDGGEQLGNEKYEADARHLTSGLSSGSWTYR